MTKEEYKKKYDKDVEAHKGAEKIAVEVLNKLNIGYHFEDVSDDEEYYNKGDIKMTKDNKIRFMDVKDDGEIAHTGNFYVEAGGYSKIYGTKKQGWIDSKYNYVAVVSQQENTIWILSFRKLKEYYKNVALTGGRKVTSNFWDNVKYGYTFPVEKAIELGVVMGKITYEYDDWIEEHTPVKYLNKKKLKDKELIRNAQGECSFFNA